MVSNFNIIASAPGLDQLCSFIYSADKNVNIYILFRRILCTQYNFHGEGIESSAPDRNYEKVSECDCKAGDW